MTKSFQLIFLPIFIFLCRCGFSTEFDVDYFHTISSSISSGIIESNATRISLQQASPDKLDIYYKKFTSDPESVFANVNNASNKVKYFLQKDSKVILDGAKYITTDLILDKKNNLSSKIVHSWNERTFRSYIYQTEADGEYKLFQCGVYSKPLNIDIQDFNFFFIKKDFGKNDFKITPSENNQTKLYSINEKDGVITEITYLFDEKANLTSYKYQENHKDIKEVYETRFLFSQYATDESGYSYPTYVLTSSNYKSNISVAVYKITNIKFNVKIPHTEFNIPIDPSAVIVDNRQSPPKVFKAYKMPDLHAKYNVEGATEIKHDVKITEQTLPDEPELVVKEKISHPKKSSSSIKFFIAFGGSFVVFLALLAAVIIKRKK